MNILYLLGGGLKSLLGLMACIEDDTNVYALTYLEYTDKSFLRNNAASVIADSCNVPHTVQPFRGTHFNVVPVLAEAVDVAKKLECNVIACGMSLYASHYQLREEDNLKYLAKFQENSELKIYTPLRNDTYADLWATLKEVEDLRNWIYTNTHGCTEGSMQQNEWGFGCGVCKKCTMKKAGWEDVYRVKR